jgi:hypothetical protein
MSVVAAGETARLEPPARGGDARDHDLAVRPREHGATVPLSYQQAMWWESERRGTAGYRIVRTEALVSPTYGGLRLRGEFDTKALQHAVDDIQRRHAALRTRFEVVDGAPVQAYAAPSAVGVERIDLTKVADTARRAAVDEAAAELALRPFDYASGVFFRVGLLRLARRDHIVFVVVPHIASDALSIKLLLDELLMIYLHASKRLQSPLPELSVQYADFVAWQQGWVRGPMRAAATEYVRRVLIGARSLVLPQADLAVDETKNPEGAMHAFTLSSEVVGEVYRVATACRVTPFMLILGAFDLLTSRWSEQTDVLQIVPFGGRPDRHTSQLVGLFSNLCPLRTDLSGNPTFADVLDRVRQTVTAALEHRHVPYAVFVEIARELGGAIPPLAVGMNSLFERAALVPRVCQPLLDTITSVESYVLDIPPSAARRQTKGDLSLWVKFAGDGSISATFVYRRSSFGAAVIRTLAAAFTDLLTAVIADPRRRGSEIRLELPHA